MPEPCPNPWYFGGCDSTFEYLWRGMASWERWVFYALALMLAYVIVIAARVSYQYYSSRHAEPVNYANEEFQRARKKLIADLSLRIHGLKSVAVTAPYLGLLGACFGVLGGFTGYIGTRHGFVVLEAIAGMTALLATAAGILVALPATLSHSFLRIRIESLETEVDSKWRKRDSRNARVAQSLPLAQRFSKLPIALVVAAVLAIYIMAFLTLASFGGAVGFGVGLAPDTCVPHSNERVIVLHVTEDKILINTEEENWNRLPQRLSEIYSTRANRTLYLLADDEVSYQRVVHTIDVVNNISHTGAPDHLEINVKLITPVAMNVRCGEFLGVPPERPNLTSRASHR